MGKRLRTPEAERDVKGGHTVKYNTERPLANLLADTKVGADYAVGRTRLR